MNKHLFSSLPSQLSRWGHIDNYLVKKILGYTIKIMFNEDSFTLEVISKKGTEVSRVVKQDDYNKMLDYDFDLADHIYDLVLDINRQELSIIKEKVWKH